MDNLPSGTVALLFTDIEGYSSMCERDPAAASLAVRRHEAVIRRAVLDQCGYEFKTMGDAFCVAFHSVAQAAAAACLAQAALNSECWQPEAIVRVRMAIHAGSVESRDGDYFGTTVNRVARLLPLGHGCQTLLSETAMELLSECMPAGSSVQPLGEYRLKDLRQPEHVYQLNPPGCNTSFPLLHSIETRLPLQLTSFIGREAELEEISGLIQRGRLVSLTGTGGCGKTRLALQAAEMAADSFRDGARFIELASVPAGDSDQLWHTLAAGLALKESPGFPIVETVVNHLQTRSMLLILDNCEHLSRTCALAAQLLLSNCPEIGLIATSRELLDIPSEIEFLVDPLEPPADAGFEASCSNKAVQLFVVRAKLAKPKFELTTENYEAVNSICTRLDGLPIAIELAAANVRMLTPKQIDGQLFRVLKSASPARLDRHRNLESLLEWSYLRISDGARVLFRRLSILPGSWEVEAAEKIGSYNDISEKSVLDLLASLRSASLIITIESETEENHFRMLETVRQYASDRRVAANEETELEDKVVNYYLQFAEQGEPKLITSSQTTWIHRLRDSYANIRLALSLANGERLLRLAGALARFWLLQGQFTEGCKWLQAALEIGSIDLSSHRAKALNGLAIFRMRLGEFDSARSLLNQSQELYSALQDDRGIADTLNHLGTLEMSLGDLDAADSHLKASYTLRVASGDRWGAAASLGNQGIVARARGDSQAALALYERSKAAYMELGDRLNAASIDVNISAVEMDCSLYSSARDHLENALAVFRSAGDRWKTAMALLNLGGTIRHLEGCRAAVPLFAECAELWLEIGDGVLMANCLAGLADLAVELNLYEAGVTLYSARMRIVERFRIMVADHDNEANERQLRTAREAVSALKCEEAWNRGLGMDARAAVDFALSSYGQQVTSK